MRVKGLEPPRLAAPDPKSGASANSATPAKVSRAGFELGGKTIGWVDSKALNTFYTPSMEKTITGTRYVLPSKQTVHYYGLPVEDSAIDRGPLSKFNGQALTLQREATIEGQLWYRVKDLGWVKAAKNRAVM